MARSALKGFQVKLLAVLLVALGGGLAWYKSTTLGLPFTPDREAEVWTVESRLTLQTEDDEPVRVEMPIPDDFSRFIPIQEDFISADFSAVIEDNADPRRAVWTARRAGGEKALYYRLQIVEAQRSEQEEDRDAVDEYPLVPEYEEPFGSAARGFLQDIREDSADTRSFTQILVRRYSDGEGDRVQMLRERADSSRTHVDNLIHILAGARIPGRTAWLLPLGDGIDSGHLEPWLQVYDGERWITFDPESGDVGLPPDHLTWVLGREPDIDIEGATFIDWTFATARTPRDLLWVAEERAEVLGSWLMRTSLVELPVQTQNVYSLILVVPIGALLVVLMRNVVGVQTFGTFMPVLIALAFRETELVLGLTLFSMVVALALLVRFYLEKLKLLLVPRLAAVLTVVVIIMAWLSVLGHSFGLDRALSVTLFPMVILAMTVERMSLVWEEAGAADALRQGTGSLAVAALAYLVINDDHLQYLLFVFPELLLVVLAITLLMGRYTGYRLTELWRFRSALLARREA